MTNKRETVNFLPVNSCVVRCKSQQWSSFRNKICERCFLCRSLQFCKVCHKCHNCSSRSTCRGQIAPVLGTMGSPGGQSQTCNSPQGRLHPPLPVPAKFEQVKHHHKLLCRCPQKPLPGGGIASAFKQKCSGNVNNSEIYRVLQQTFAGSKTQQVSTGSTCIFTSKVLPVQSTAIWSLHSSHEVYDSGKRGQIAGITEG